MEQQSSSRQRATIALIVLGVLSLSSAAIVAMVTDARDEVSSVDSDSFSISAIGHDALEQTLRRAHPDVSVTRWATGDAAAEASLVMLLEPHLIGTPTEEQRVVDTISDVLHRSPATILVLPKRDGMPSYDDKWIDQSFLLPADDVARVLTVAKISGSVVRTGGASDRLDWRTHHQDFGDSALEIPEVQLLDSPQVAPIISAPEGILFGEVLQPYLGSTRLFVLSDPDVLANHGLHRADHASLARVMVETAKAPGSTGPIILDEIIHGHLQPPTIGRMMMEFPFVILTMQGALFLLLVLWAGVFRFGPPRDAERSLKAGHDLFLDNTAELLTSGRHTAYSVERYVWMTIEEVAHKLGAPRELQGKALQRWVQGATASRARSEGVDLEAITERASDLSTRKRPPSDAAVLALALKINRWKKEILDGAR